MTADPFRDPEFQLDPRLEADTFFVGEMKLATLRLMNDARFAWLILVPRQAGLAELIDLDGAARAELTAEIDAVSRALRSVTGCDKLNVAALGNMVRQLHIHVIARFTTDAAWPGPVWGVGERVAYGSGPAAELMTRLRVELGLREPDAG